MKLKKASIQKTRQTMPSGPATVGKKLEYSLGFMWTPTRLDHVKADQFTHAAGKLAKVKLVHRIWSGENREKFVVIYLKFSFRITDEGKKYEWENELSAIIGSPEHEIPIRGSLEPDGQIIFC